jgi:DNA-binding winged helix-turn-helix (wHTH) protein
MNAASVVSLSDAPIGSRAKSAKRVVSNPVRVRFGAFELDEPNALLLRDGKAIMLAPKPFGLLCALARRPGSLLTKDALLDDIWGHQFVSDSVLRTAVTEVRTVLDDPARNPKFIETVSRRGYRFIAATTAVSNAPAEGTLYFIRPNAASPRCDNPSACPDTIRAACERAPDPLDRTIANATLAWNSALAKRDDAWLKPAYPTVHEIRYAHELKLRIRSRYLAEAPIAASPWCVGVE